MKSLIAFTLLATSISAPAFGDASTASAAPLNATVAAGSLAAAQIANAHMNGTRAGLETPTADCCYDEVNLDRKPPLPRAARGPDCCWDPSNWN